MRSLSNARPTEPRATVDKCQRAVSVFANPSLSRAFDFGGGWLLVKEAGGVFTDITGNSIDSVEVGLKKTASLLVSGNKRLHEISLKLLNKTRD